MWKYEGLTYQSLMIECSGIAGTWNSHRTKSSDRVWIYTDFHPDHFQKVIKRTGREIVREQLSIFGPDGIEWAEGYSLEKI